jgi:hypothetical protein
MRMGPISPSPSLRKCKLRVPVWPPDSLFLSAGGLTDRSDREVGGSASPIGLEFPFVESDAMSSAGGPPTVVSCNGGPAMEIFMVAWAWIL